MLEFKVPEVGENIESGNVVGISVAVGDSIKKDQDLFELETDKASLPVPAPCDGVIKEVLIAVGDEVKIGQVVIKIEASGDAPKTESAPSPAPEKTQPTSIPQSAPAPAKASAAPAAAATAALRSVPNTMIPAQEDIPAAPSVRRLARELGLNISQVPGTGPGGRISKDDIKVFAKQIILGGGQPASAPKKPLPDFTKFGAVEREAMNNIRKKTVENMAYFWNTIAAVTQFDKADITEIDKLRKEKSTPQRKLTVTSFILKVMADALKEFPKFNASIDTETNEIIYKKYVNLGIAVDTERGLLVPVLRDVDKKDVFQITDELNDLAERARNRKVTLDDLQGGSMTLTNLGGIGGHAFTPIVNWPEVAILGVSRGGLEPVYQDGQFVPRLKLPFSLSYDHRLIDGADAARFLRWVCEALERVTL